MSDALAEAPAKKRIPWRGRPRVADPKGKRIAVRCTGQDHEFIAQTAAEAGLSMAAFLRALALGSTGPRAVRRPAIERETLARILGELGKLGSNVNQIAHWANAVRAAPSLRELELMQADIAAMRAAILKALDRGD